MISTNLKRALAVTAIMLTLTACGSDASAPVESNTPESNIPRGEVVSEEEYGFGWVTTVRTADGQVCYVASDNRGIAIDCPVVETDY